MADNDVLMGVIADKDHELAALREENATLEAKLARCVEALELIAGSTLAGPCKEYINCARAALYAAKGE